MTHAAPPRKSSTSVCFIQPCQLSRAVGCFSSWFGFIKDLINALELVNVLVPPGHQRWETNRRWSIATCSAALTLLFRGESKRVAFLFFPQASGFERKLLDAIHRWSVAAMVVPEVLTREEDLRAADVKAFCLKSFLSKIKHTQCCRTMCHTHTHTNTHAQSSHAYIWMVHSNIQSFLSLLWIKASAFEHKHFPFQDVRSSLYCSSKPETRQPCDFPTDVSLFHNELMLNISSLLHSIKGKRKSLKPQ